MALEARFLKIFPFKWTLVSLILKIMSEEKPHLNENILSKWKIFWHALMVEYSLTGLGTLAAERWET